jgi:EAL domain-containing protein (putative c-di-GMP-specific phosphodiesterase class I)
VRRRRCIRLRELGVRVAIDDFGTGYSSLDHPRQFPVDTIKIDRSFVARLNDDGEDRAIVASLLSLAATVGVRVIAEGVERLRESHPGRLRERRAAPPVQRTAS